MQVRLPLLAAVALLLVASPGAAHEEHETDCDRRSDTWNHLGLWKPEVAPGERAERDLGFEGCPLEEDWRLLLRGDVDGTLAVTLLQSGEELLSSTWNGTGNFEAATLPHTDFLTLRLENVGDRNATARLYFDQTCLCTAKGVQMVPGPVWMSTEAAAGDLVSFNVTVIPASYPAQPDLPETITVRAVIPGDPSATQAWTFHPGLDPACGVSSRWTGCFEYTLQAPESGRQDVLLWLDHDGGEDWMVGIRPVIEVQGVERGAPGPGAVLVLAALATAATAAVSFRRR